jgi:hypothetical protein
MYNWVRTCLLAPSGMYYDHLDSAGRSTPMAELYALLAGSPPLG